MACAWQQQQVVGREVRESMHIMHTDFFDRKENHRRSPFLQKWVIHTIAQQMSFVADQSDDVAN